MKEYISKEGFLSKIHGETDLNQYRITIDAFNSIPIVTDLQICREWELEVLKNIELGINSTGHSDQYSTGFCNGLIWLRSCITGEKPEFLEMEGKV